MKLLDLYTPDFQGWLLSEYNVTYEMFELKTKLVHYFRRIWVPGDVVSYILEVSNVLKCFQCISILQLKIFLIALCFLH